MQSAMAEFPLVPPSKSVMIAVVIQYLCIFRILIDNVVFMSIRRNEIVFILQRRPGHVVKLRPGRPVIFRDCRSLFFLASLGVLVISCDSLSGP